MTVYVSIGALLVALAAAPLSRALGQCAPVSSDSSRTPRGGVGTSAVSGTHEAQSPLAQLVLVGSVTDDRLRLRNDLGSCADGGTLVRSPMSLGGLVPRVGSGPTIAALTPVLSTTWNSTIPVSMNDGALWAGRGLSTILTFGARARVGPLTVVIAPELIRVQNLGFPIIASGDSARSAFASPWHSGPESADLPLRFGNQPYTQVTPGQSTVELAAGSVGVGVSSENQWWGPGIENGLIMSNNAAGIPQAYVRTLHPVHTSLGDFEGRWFVGGLSQSLYFDTTTSNNLRSLSAAVVTFRPAAEPTLTLGIARAVYASVSGADGIPGHLADVFTQWNQTPDSISASDSIRTDQLMSLFASWVFPEGGFEFYGEWARIRLPRSLQELLVDPQRTDGLTVGLQWVRPVLTGSAIRFQTEATALEQTPPTAGANVPSFYTSSIVPQGYTQRGQVIGAAIGPGSSSQSFVLDYLTPSQSIGLVAGRIRWEDDAYYRQPSGIAHYTHDISLYAGIRASTYRAHTEISAQLLVTDRLNYLFQTATSGYTWSSAFDMHNLTLQLSLTPGAASPQAVARP